MRKGASTEYKNKDGSVTLFMQFTPDYIESLGGYKNRDVEQTKIIHEVMKADVAKRLGYTPTIVHQSALAKMRNLLAADKTGDAVEYYYEAFLEYRPNA